MADTEINTDKFEPVRVTCYSGYKADDSQLHLIFRAGGEISKILDRWYEGSMSPEAPLSIIQVWATCAAGKIILSSMGKDTHAWAVLIRDPA
ncbi:MAG: hypothetical protein R2874_06145 [Desulfobacterales bacterium]